MTTRISAQALTRWQALVLLAVAAGSAAIWLYATRVSDAVVYLEPDPAAQWIASAQPASLQPVRIPRDEPFVARFGTRFEVRGPEGAEARLRVRAVRGLELFLNDRPVPLEGRDPARWKQESTVDVSEHLVPGSNHLVAVVSNFEGPALLWLAIEGLGQPVASGRGWWIEHPDRNVPARYAIDVRRVPRADQAPTPAEGLRARAGPLAAAFLLCALPVWLLPAGARRSAERHAVAIAAGAVALFWAVLYATKAAHFPATLGFDVNGHYEYLRFLAEERRIPIASDGWSTFHPPLYYVATAALRGLFGSAQGETLDGFVLHFFPVVAGLASALFAGALVRRLAPGEPLLAAASTLVAGLLPINVLLGSLVSNEAVNAGLVGLVLLLAADAMVRERATPRALAGLALAGSAALLAKTTSLPVVAAAFAGVGLKLWLVEGRSLARSAAAVAGVLAGVGVLAGWFYARNVILFGNPFVTNYDLPDATYWLAPGFHTPAWYASFGAVLEHPFFASYAGFWDGLYSTFFGDGQASGMLGIAHPSPFWDYEAMAAGYWLAAPAVALLGLGFFAMGARAVRSEPGPRLAWSLLLATGYGMSFLVLLTTLRYPHYALPKAFYALPALAAFAAAFALGIVALDTALRERVGGVTGRTLRSLLHGWLGALACAWLLAYLGRGLAA